jgi:hypothetical protein
MPLHQFEQPRGRIEMLAIESTALGENLFGDPPERSVAIYLPEGYDGSDVDYPLVVHLAGFLGSGLRQVGWRTFGPNVLQRLDRLASSGKMGPVIAAFPDSATSLGGTQYVDSLASGGWERFVLDELLPRIEARFRVRRGARHRAILGKSSGGYGALLHGMRHGEAWGAVAAHAPDCGFEIVYARDFPCLLDELAPHGGDPARFVDYLRRAEKVSRDESHALMLLCMAACYDPDPAAALGIRLPVDPETSEIDPEAWARWLAHDPVRMIDDRSCQENLRRLGGLYLDCGRQDEYGLHYGLRSLVRKLERLGIPHDCEEFDGGHGDTDDRLDRSLPFLYAAIK